MENLAITYYVAGTEPEYLLWVKQLLNKIPEMHLLLIVYAPGKNSVSFWNGYTDRIHKVVIKKESSLDSQVTIVLNEANKLSPQTIQLIPHKAFPAGLFEQINRTKKNSTRYFSIAPIFQLLDEQATDRFDASVDHQQILAHKNTEKTLEQKDLEFCYDLFDEEEQNEIDLAVQSPSSVLILGGKGSGKTLLARYIHFHTDRTAHGAFIHRNAAAVPDTLIESELNGVVDNYLPGVSKKEGWLKPADKGTLFLDEIAESSQDLQTKLLLIITEKVEPIEIVPLGGTAITVFPRFIAATNVPEDILVEKPGKGGLRKDFLDRFKRRIHLKNLYQKKYNGKTDGFYFVKIAIRHYTSYLLRYNPNIIPEWDWDTLIKLYDEKILPDSLRGLTTYINDIFERRRLSNKLWNKNNVSKDEIYLPFKEKDINSINTLSPVSARTLQSSISEITNSGVLDNLKGMSPNDVKELVFLVKKLALDIAKKYSPDNFTLAKAVYNGETSSYNAFIDLWHNSQKLHPDKRLRK